MLRQGSGCVGGPGRRILALDEEADPESQSWNVRTRALGGVLSLAGCCLGAGIAAGHQPMRARRADVGSAVELQAWPGAVAPTADPGVAQGFQQPPQMSNALDSYFNLMIGPPPSEQTQFSDGGKCADNEEYFGNLCYMKCSLLTNGTHPLRTSAWTCCQADHLTACGLNNQKHDMGLCSGYDVAGDAKSCPKAAGLCLENEETFGGQCYHKCSILTNGTHPHRTSGISCCDVTSSWDCFKPSHVVLSPGYNIGGKGKPGGRVAAPNPTFPPALPLVDPGAVVTPR